MKNLTLELFCSSIISDFPWLTPTKLLEALRSFDKSLKSSTSSATTLKDNYNLITPKAAAEMLGISPRTLSNLCKSGALPPSVRLTPGVKLPSGKEIGGTVRHRLADILDFIKKRTPPKK